MVPWISHKKQLKNIWWLQLAEFILQILRVNMKIGWNQYSTHIGIFVVAYHYTVDLFEEKTA